MNTVGIEGNQMKEGIDSNPEKMRIIARLTNVVKIYQSGDTQCRALDNVSLEIAAGEFLAIMGPSGSGKSTLLHCAAGLSKIDSGQIEIDGQKISQLRDGRLTKLRAQKIGFVFQAYNLIPILTAQQNIVLPLKGGLKKLPAAKQIFFDELIKILGIEDCLGRRPAQLSGGQQQKVAIARALITHPAILFADEPTGNLDSKSSDDLLRFFSLINQKYGQTVVIITHNAHVATYSRRTIFIRDGRLFGQITRQASRAEITRALEQLEANNQMINNA